jgi:CheY-like chemotaxis protein
LIEPIYIFLTTFGSSKAFEDLALKNGVDHVFNKPLKPEELQTVSDLLSN